MIPDIAFPIPNSPIHHSERTPNSRNPDPSLPAAAGTLNPSKRGRPLVFDALKQHTFLRLVAVGFSSRRAARLVGVNPSTVREMAARNMVFASGYKDAKAQAIPVLAENVYHAGKRSWRASAWLLERLRPSQFGRRVALGPDPAKRREDERLREEKKKEQLDLQKPELNDQILIRCIKRLFTDHRAQEIFEACADDFDRQAAEQAQAAGGKPQSSTNPVDDSDSDPPMETRSVSEELIDHVIPPELTTRPPDQRSAVADTRPPDTASHDIETRCLNEELTPTGPAHSTPAYPELAQPTFCAPPPSANNSASSITAPTTETQSPLPQLPIAPLPTPPSFCALTPCAHCAEIPQVICADNLPIAPNRPPTLPDSPRPQSIMMTFG